MSQDPTDPQPDAISAVKALQMASAEGQRIYQITQANMDTALSNIHHDGKGEIQAALQAGMTVITHTDSVSVPGWTGAGYIILDPEYNTGAYKISGGSNGGLIVFGAIFALMGALMFVMVLSAVAGIAAMPLGVGVIAFAAYISGLMIAVGASLLYAAYALSVGDIDECNLAIATAVDLVGFIEVSLVSVKYPGISLLLGVMLIYPLNKVATYVASDVCLAGS